MYRVKKPEQQTVVAITPNVHAHMTRSRDGLFTFSAAYRECDAVTSGADHAKGIFTNVAARYGRARGGSGTNKGNPSRRV